MLKRPILTVKATCAEWRAMLALADNGAAAKAVLPDYMLVTGPEMPPQVAVILFERCRQLFFALCDVGLSALLPPVGYDVSLPPHQIELVSEAAKREPGLPEGEPIVPYRAEAGPWLAMAELVKFGLPEDFVEADMELKEALDFGNPEPIEKQATEAFEVCEEVLHRIEEVVCIQGDPFGEMERFNERQERIASGKLAQVLPFQPELFSR